MEKKLYEQPELEVVEIVDTDVLSASFGDDWTGSEDGDYGYPWLP